jgi:hypothetical protein
VKITQKYSEGNVFSKTIYHVVLLPGIEGTDKDPDNKTYLFSLLFDEYLDLQFILKKMMLNIRMAGVFQGEGVLCTSIFYKIFMMLALTEEDLDNIRCNADRHNGGNFRLSGTNANSNS